MMVPEELEPPRFLHLKRSLPHVNDGGIMECGTNFHSKNRAARMFTRWQDDASAGQ